ncbi:MAG TPA: galactose-1-epimerase, partial [Ruminococcaceae bacterium]|nr:galactose-1-epimerase [Oscillospiraceae bacterium]
MAVGRFANRIAGGRFTLDGETYQVVCNENNDKSLHSNGEFSEANFNAEILGENAVRFTLVSPDGTFGFPGTLNAAVTYTFNDENEVIIDYRAVSDKTTLINLTNHAYFNLGGCLSGDVLGHELMIDADFFTPTTPDSIPTGEIRPVEGTPFDFRTAKPIGKEIHADYDQLTAAKGYDHNFCLNKGDGVKMRAYEPKSGRTLSVTTDCP